MTSFRMQCTEIPDFSVARNLLDKITTIGREVVQDPAPPLGQGALSNLTVSPGWTHQGCGVPFHTPIGLGIYVGGRKSAFLGEELMHKRGIWGVSSLVRDLALFFSRESCLYQSLDCDIIKCPMSACLFPSLLSAL